MTGFTRRYLGALLAGTGTVLALGSARAQAGLTIYTAGQGSAFLPYGQGLGRYLDAAAGLKVEIAESKGSVENAGKVEEGANALATVFLGTAFEALNGLAWANGKRHAKLRALAPMYETSFQIAVPGGSTLRDVKSLDGKQVGIGPAGGPAEGYFKALAEIAGITPKLVAGNPADLAKKLIAKEIDALWQGAIVPIPSLVEVQKGDAGAIVFGLTDAEVEGMLKRFPFMAKSEVAPGTYANQPAVVKSISAWNFVLANADLAEETAYRITRAMISAQVPEQEIHAFAKGVSAQNATANRIIPFHPGAVRALKERGVTV
ncbi:MAG: TAXI family TRAP transporter solute-binding subunit [Methylobacterium sp.]|nr:TAXI family TRAP transporter solute-binding subunit [Methylobacterium sp.]